MYDSQGKVVSSNTIFNWCHEPRDISFNQAVDEFSELFESIINKQTQDKKIILPLSGGIDSRTQAVALNKLDKQVFSYSYKFKNGYDETKISRQIANACNFKFKGFTIEKGYLWNKIDEISTLNQCFADFTTPRQAAIHDYFETMGAVFSLGHWGDVLFDNMNLPNLTLEEEVNLLYKKLIKRGGEQFAIDLWKDWDIEGDFKSYFKSRLVELLNTIKIDNSNSKLRAFKSKYWAPRWTSANLPIFSSKKPITLPYYHDDMCKFICTIPEAYLKNRQIQIEYIKRYSPKLAKIIWQDARPFNLTNYQKNKYPNNLPYKIINKTKRTVNSLLGENYIQRNWELQFQGKENNAYLKQYLFNSSLENFVPKSIVNNYFENFTNKDALKNAHAINILLVLSKFSEKLVLNEKAN